MKKIGMKDLSREQCISLLKKYKNPDNIIAHSMVVNEVSCFLAKKLILSGETLDYDMVNFGSLLHDIDKFQTLNTKNHAILAKRWLDDMGLRDISKVVFSHKLGCVLHKKTYPKNWEEKIIYYADKRVKYDMIVTLKDRFNYLRNRYGKLYPESMRKIDSAEPEAYKIEKEIFDTIGINPLRLKYNIEKEREDVTKLKKNTKAIVFDFWNTLAVNKGSKDYYMKMPVLLGIEKDKGWGRIMEEGLMLDRFDSRRDAFENLVKLIRKKKGRYDGKNIGHVITLWDQMDKKLNLFDDSYSVLKRLKKKYKIGIISNTQSFSINCGKKIFDMADEVSLSCDEHLLKPDKKIFERMVKKLGVKARETVMVGDNYHDDVLAANEAGYEPIQIRRNSSDLTHKETKFYKNLIISLHDLERIFL